jgi:hypothetical protein
VVRDLWLEEAAPGRFATEVS